MVRPYPAVPLGSGRIAGVGVGTAVVGAVRAVVDLVEGVLVLAPTAAEIADAASARLPRLSARAYSPTSRGEGEERKSDLEQQQKQDEGTAARQPPRCVRRLQARGKNEKDTPTRSLRRSGPAARRAERAPAARLAAS